MNDTKNTLSSITILLHWLIAFTIITLMTVGIYMSETETYSLYDIHKSIGVIIFLFIIIRVVWRIKKGWPEPLRHYQPIEQILSIIVHYMLLIGTLLFPVSGFIMSLAGGHGVAVFGIELFAANPDPSNPLKVIPLDTTLAEIGHTMHSLLGYIMLLALVLHIAGALKHHFIDRDETLLRMSGRVAPQE